MNKTCLECGIRTDLDQICIYCFDRISSENKELKSVKTADGVPVEPRFPPID